jgi:hypothetical protein
MTSPDSVSVKLDSPLHSISVADDMLMQGLIWLLIARGVLPKEDISQMIGGCIDQANSAPNPNKPAILHLEMIRANIERAGQVDQ